MRYPEHSHPRDALFFAAMLSAEARASAVSRLADFRALYALKAKPIAPSRFHLTVRPIYSGSGIPQHVLHLAKCVGDAIRFEQFEVVLERALTFRSRQVRKPFVLATRTRHSEFEALGQHIDRTLSMISQRPSFMSGSVTPHVTLLWDQIEIEEQAILPVNVHVREITLVHSHVGQARYDLLQRWQLVE